MQRKNTVRYSLDFLYICTKAADQLVTISIGMCWVKLSLLQILYKSRFSRKSDSLIESASL
jgi:hypothetical protein